MKKKNKKAAIGGVMILSLVMVMGILLVSAVMFRFLLGFMAVAGGKTGGKVCARTIEYKIGWDNDIDGMEDSATLDRPGFGDGMIINWWMDDPVGSVNDGIASVSTTLRGSVQPVCNKYTTKCKGTADEVARCLHARAADTYYSLAGYSYGDASVKTAQEMTLLEIETQVTAPGNITLRGKCNTYIKDYWSIPDDSMTLCKNREVFEVGNDDSIVEWLEPCVQEIKTLMGDTYCNIAFGTVDGYTIALTGMYDCSKTAKGPESLSCLCYPKARKKNNVGNGIAWTGIKSMEGKEDVEFDNTIGISSNNAVLKLDKNEKPFYWNQYSYQSFYDYLESNNKGGHVPGSLKELTYGEFYKSAVGCNINRIMDEVGDSQYYFDFYGTNIPARTIKKITPQTAWWEEHTTFPDIENTRLAPMKLYTRLFSGVRGYIDTGPCTITEEGSASDWLEPGVDGCYYYAPPIISNHE